MAELQLTVRLQKSSALYNSITYINVEGFSTIDTWLAFCPLPFRDDHAYKSCTTKKLEFSSGQFNLNGDRTGEGGSPGTANWARLRLEFP